MTPEESITLFRDRLSAAGLILEALLPSEALAQTLSFYREVRAEKCDLETEGDMLLFEWGTYEWATGEDFHLDFTRQFILDGDEDDDGISQLFIRLHYPLTDELKALGSGNHWCEHPNDLAKFEELVLANEAYRVVVAVPSKEVTVDWSLV